MRDPKQFPILMGRMLLLTLLAGPAAFVSALGLILAVVAVTVAVPPVGAGLMGTALGMGALIFAGPGLLTAYLILFNQYAENRVITRGGIARAAIWGGALVLIILISNASGIVPKDHIGPKMWVIPAVIFGLLAEAAVWP